MTSEHILPWLNLLLLPVTGLLMQIRAEIAALQAVQGEHARRLDRIESGL